MERLGVVGICPMRKEQIMNDIEKKDRALLKANLYKLDSYKMKLFYGILVHCWASKKAFISTQNFRNLWCELNYLCSTVDEGFPDPYDDYELLRSFCCARPYYFIDMLSPEVVIDLFCEHLEERLDIVATIAQKLDSEGLRSAYEYTNEVLKLTDNIDESVAQAEEHVKQFS
jgi:hypothetical protein